MKKLLKPFQYGALALTLLFAVSCNNDDDNNDITEPPVEELSIYETAVATDDLSSLVAALEASGLDTTLDGEGDFTVFAPTNAAFEPVLTALGVSSPAEIDPATLEAVLTYHVIASNRIASSQIANEQSVATVNGESLIFLVGDNVQIIDGTNDLTTVTNADIAASNGVIHIVDKVMFPADIADALEIGRTSIADVAEAAGFTSLLAAAEAAGLSEVLDSPLTDVTVFAPTNDAFAAFLEANNFASVDEIPVDVLQNVLLNHAVMGSVLSGDIQKGYVNTLGAYPTDDVENPAFLSMYLKNDAGVQINGGPDNGGANVVTTTPGETFDIETDNGVIHVVDAVIALPTIATFAVADADNFSELTGALVAEGQSDFVGVLSDPANENAPFTVFAPVNAAFEALTSAPTAEELTAILSHHVVAGANVRSTDLEEGDNPVTTLNGDITVTLPPTQGGIADITDGSGETGSVIVVDVQAINGVVHAIDKVLIPAQ
ncbi:fasciclin domain-containing protein [Robertkochia marina]|uniref:Fasciclin domain-containing protein n=1 Tax=Robertkochia marina TaxID=1227945 RepID=A0A4S3LX15_9FLAO|nr:fasciclin domain-containing protein [Robertkochia marina]THD65726.1 fasciclin domain-containing protein [Robertkochia marina]TRZ46589.1 fasciclin domain-containing protein [Robertkochia marina]